MKNILLGAAAVAVALAFGAHADTAAAKTYVFALVPKNTGSPWFDQARDGCKKAEKELAGAIECLYVGPGEHGGGEEQVQVVADLISKKVDGIAVDPANAAAMGKELAEAKQAGIPVIAWDSDLLPKDKALRIAYVGTNNYEIGASLAKAVMAIKPHGGHIVLLSGGAAAANLNERLKGMRDTLSGKVSASSPGDKLAGENGWTEESVSPLYCNDDSPLAVQQMEDTFGKYPKLDALIAGGWPQFATQAYKNVVSKVKSRLDDGSLALAVTDTLPQQMDLLKAGLSNAQIGQQPFAMGYKVMYFLKDIKDGKAPPADPTYTSLDICTAKTADTCISH
jgi:ribose transport system substrate-binding protein